MFVFVDEGFILINLELTSSRVYLEVSISISVSGTIDTIAIDLEDLKFQKILICLFFQKRSDNTKTILERVAFCFCMFLVKIICFVSMVQIV